MVDTKQQILMVAGGLMVAFGFMFMGAASLSGLTPSGSSQPSQEEQQINATLPEENYAEDGFDLSMQEQAYLSVNNEVVFVTAIYSEDASVFDEIDNVHENFDGRVYFSKVNSTETNIDEDLQLTDYPQIIVVGDQQTQRAPYSVRRAENEKSSVVDVICGSMRNVGDVAAACY